MAAVRTTRLLWWTLIVGLTVATVAAGVVGGWQMSLKGRQSPPVADQSADRDAATEAARTGTIRILTYSPDTLDQDFRAAEAMLTGDFLDYYKQFSREIVAPAARQKQVKTSATVESAGVATLTRDAATVLAFIKQSTVSNVQPEPSVTISAVIVSLAHVRGTWLINQFNPV